MVIEVKRTLFCGCHCGSCQIKKSEAQISDAYEKLKLFGPDINDFWFVPVAFCLSHEEGCDKEKDFLIMTPDNMPEKFDRIVQEIDEKRGQKPVSLDPEVFKTIAGFMIFGTSKTLKNQLPVNNTIIKDRVEKSWKRAGEYEIVMLWTFWNRTQLNLCASYLTRVILSGKKYSIYYQRAV